MCVCVVYRLCSSTSLRVRGAINHDGRRTRSAHSLQHNVCLATHTENMASPQSQLRSAHLITTVSIGDAMYVEQRQMTFKVRARRQYNVRSHHGDEVGGHRVGDVRPKTTRVRTHRHSHSIWPVATSHCHPLYRQTQFGTSQQNQTHTSLVRGGQKMCCACAHHVVLGWKVSAIAGKGLCKCCLARARITKQEALASQHRARFKRSPRKIISQVTKK
jgi:hypothetical protein